MQAFTDKSSDNKDHSDKQTEKKPVQAAFSGFADNRPEARVQQQLSTAMNNSAQSKQFQSYTQAPVQRKTLEQADLKGDLKDYGEKKTAVGDEPLVSHIYEEHIPEGKVKSKAEALYTAAVSNGDMGKTIHDWGKRTGAGKKPGKDWESQQMFTLTSDKLNQKAVPTLDPFFYGVTVPYTEEGEAETLILVFQHARDLQGYVETIIDTSNDATKDAPSMYKGKADKAVKSKTRNQQYPQLHDTKTGDTNLLGHTEGAGESNLDAYTKIAGEGARWVCVRHHIAQLRDTSRFYTKAGAPDGKVFAVTFRKLWVSWKSTFAKEYNIPDSVVVAKIKNIAGYETLNLADMTAQDYNLD